MTRIKKLTALLLAFVMIFSSMSIMASALEWFEDSTVTGSKLEYTVKFFRQVQGSDGTAQWVETTRAKPGEDVIARFYLKTDFLAGSQQYATVFNKQFFDIGLIPGISNTLTTNPNLFNGEWATPASSSAWHKDNINIVVEGVIKECGFDEVFTSTYDFVFTLFSPQSATLSFPKQFTGDEWLCQIPMKVKTDGLATTVGSSGDTRVVTEAYDCPDKERGTYYGTIMKCRYPNININASSSNSEYGVGSKYWYGDLETNAGYVTTTSNVILNANGGAYSVGEDYFSTSKISGIIGTQVLGINNSENKPQKENSVLVGWSLTSTGAALTSGEIAELTYDYEDLNLYAVWQDAIPAETFYTYQQFLMNTDGTYSSTPSYTQQIMAPANETVELTKTPIAGFTLDEILSDSQTVVNGSNTATLKAYYARNQYDVTYHYEDENGTQTESDSIYFGAAIPSFKAVPGGHPIKEGYTFDSWSLNADSKVAVPTTMPAEDVDIYPIFNKTVYTYIFDATQGGAFANGNRTMSFVYNYGDTPVAPEVPAKPGFTFVDWEEDMPATVTGDMTFTAMYNSEEYSVTFMDGDNTVGEGKGVYYYGESVETDEIPEGYKASAWTLADGTVVNFPYTVTGDTVLYATDAANVYNADFYVDGVLYKSVPTVYGEEIVPPSDPTKTGYNFVMWDPDADGAVMEDYDMRFDAQFEVAEFTITFNTDGGTEIAPITQNYGTEVTAPANPAKDGYTFINWNTPVPTTMPANDMQITALWSANTYTIKFVDTDGSLIDIIVATTGSAVTAPEDPTKTGYTFTGWNKDVPQTMPAGNTTITATWSTNSYTISFDTDGGVPAVIPSIEQDYGTSVNAPANPTKDGFTFGGWADATGRVVGVPATMPADDVALTAVWNANTKLATFNANGGAFADGKTVVNLNVAYGDAITAPENPTRDGYTFSSWSPTVPELMPNEDMIFNAVWTPIPSGSVEYSIDVITINPATQQALPPVTVNGTAAPGETVEIILAGGTSDADKVYIYEELINSESNVPDADNAGNVLSITVTESASNKLTAYFKLATLTATFDANSGKFDDDSATKEVSGTYGTALVAPVPTRIGYTFAGWDKVVPGTLIETATYTAQWEINSHYAIFNIDGEEYTRVSYEFGETITAPAYVAPAGYSFGGWSIPDGALMGDADQIYDAALTPIDYTFTYSLTSAPVGVTAPSAVGELNVGDTVTLAAPTDIDGYDFDGWYINNVKYLPGAEFTMPAGNVTVTGAYTAKTYTIQFNTNGGTFVEQVPYACGTNVTSLPSTSKAGSGFAGWINSDTKESVTAPFIMPAQDLVLEAQWLTTIETRNLTYSYTGEVPAGAPAVPAAVKVTVGDAVNVADVPQLSGYTFHGWYYNNRLTESFIMPSSDVTITGYWTEDSVAPTTYTLTLNANGGAFADGESSFSADFEAGQVVTTPDDPTRSGYRLIGWTDAIGNAASIPTNMPASNLTLTAVWAELFDVTYEVDGEEYAKFVNAAIEGDTLPVPAAEPEKANYIFNGWVDKTTNQPVTQMPAADVVLVPVWTAVVPDTYTLKYYDGTDLLTTAQYAAGATIEAYAPDAKIGYTFNGWLNMPADGKMPAQNIEVFAQWTANEHDITLNANGGKFADDSEQFTDTVDYGTVLSTVVPNSPTRIGYTFDGWVVTGTSTPASIPVTMPDADINLTAKWSVNQYTITFDTDDGSAVQPITQNYGTAVTAPANPTKANNNFVRWEPSVPPTMPAENITVKAIWEPIVATTYTLTLNANGGKFADNSTTKEKIFNYGAAIGTIEEPTRENYTFVSWSPEIPSTMPASDVTVEAVWRENEDTRKTVEYYLVNGGQVWNSAKYETEETINHPTPSATDITGFTFEGWFFENGEPAPTKMGETDIKLYAKLTPKMFKVTYMANNAVFAEFEEVPYGSEIPKPASDPVSTTPGMLFAGWEPNVAATMPAHDVTYTAKWVAEPGSEFAAKYVVDGSTYALYVLKEGDKIPVPEAPEKFGYKFVGWEPEVPSTMPAEDIEFVAQWELDKEFITVVIGGTVIAGGVIAGIIGVNVAIITGISIIGGILVIIGASELVKHTHTVTYMVDGEVYKTYKVVEGTKIPVPADPDKDGFKFTGWDPEVPEKMGDSDLVFNATFESKSDVVIPDTGSVAGIAAFATISAAAAAAYVITRKKKED